MRSAIKEYLNLSEDEKIELWENAVFVFDTNIFLNLYRYSEDTRNSLLNAMRQLSNRIWMPKQVAQELMNNRPKVIFEIQNKSEELTKEKEKLIKRFREILHRGTTDPKIQKLSEEIGSHIDELIEESNYIKSIEDDEILNQLLYLYDKKVGNGFSYEELEVIMKDGNERYDKKIPPGYKDGKKDKENDTFGDLIIWKEILSFAKNDNKDVIFVTEDTKEDWWYRIEGRTLGPRVELKKEFSVETNQRFHMYTMERFLEQFKNIHGTQIQQSAIDEVKNHEQLLEEKRRQLKIEESRMEKIRQLNLQRHYLQRLLQELESKQEYLEKHISELKHSFAVEDIDKCQSIRDLNEIEMKTKDIEHSQMELNKIIEQKIAIKKELKILRLKRNDICHIDI